MGRRRSIAIAVAAALVVTLLSSHAPASAAVPPTTEAGAAAPLTAASILGTRATGSITAEAHRVDLRTAPRATDPNEVHGLDRLAVPRSTPGRYVGPSPRLATTAGATGPGPASGFAPQVAAGVGIQKGTDFPGQHEDCRAGSYTCLEPPNSAVAVSGSYVVEFDNTVVAIFDRSGTQLVSPVPFSTLFAEPAGETGDSDPHVLYDAAKGRWFATELSWNCSTQVGSLYLAVSSSSDPRGVWDSFRFAVAGYLTDYPDLAVSSDKVAVSTNLYPLTGGSGRCFGSFSGGLLGVMDLSAVLAREPVYTYSLESGYTDAASWRPAGDPSSSTIYAVGEGLAGDVLYGRITGTQAVGNLTFADVYDLTLHGLAAGFDVPPMPRQKGSPSTIANAFDERATDAVWSAGRLWFVATAPCTPSGDTLVRDCVRLVQLVTNATPSVNQDFLIADNGFDDFMGGIGLSGVGALFMVYSQSSPTTFVSTYARTQERGAAKDTIDTPILVDQGLDTYDGTRWGDYVVVSGDPAMPTAVWEADEYPAASGDWTTTVSQLLVEATYVALPGPVRILDTRKPTGLSGPFVNHKPRTFQVTGRGGVPTNAVAVTGNLTVTGQQAAGYVSLTTTPLTSPSTSTLNFPLADVRANGVTTPLGSGGTLSATYVGGSATSSTQLVFDVTGYFVPASAGATYAPLPPARILDTRGGTGLSGPFVRGVPRAFQVVGRGGVPTGAVAVTGNLTVTGQTAAGYVSLTTKGTPTPSTSTLNFPLQDVRANGVTMPLGTGADLGKLWATYVGGPPGSTTALVFDITGYYAPGVSGAFYVPLTPVRALDTRTGNGLSGPFVDHVARTLQITGRDNAPAGASGITANLTMVGQTASGYVSITLAPATNPTTSTLNSPVGDIRANNLAAPLTSGAPGTSGKLSGTYVGGPAGGHDATQLILDVTGYFVPAS